MRIKYHRAIVGDALVVISVFGIFINTSNFIFV